METEKFKNKYRIKSARRQGYDYSKSGFYFVTICTKNREIIFGDIKNEKNILSPIGKIVKKEWLNTLKIRKNIRLDEFIIMPNHLHGIVVIEYKIDNHSVIQGKQDVIFYKNKFGPQSNNLSSVIRGFKGAVTKIIRQNFSDIDFMW